MRSTPESTDRGVRDVGNLFVFPIKKKKREEVGRGEEGETEVSSSDSRTDHPTPARPPACLRDLRD